MVLHLVPDGFDQVGFEEIRLFEDDPAPRPADARMDKRQQRANGDPSIDRMPLPRHPIAVASHQRIDACPSSTRMK